MGMPVLSVQQIEILFGSFPQPSCIIHTGYIIKANRAFCQAVNYSEIELAAQEFINFIHPQDQKNTIDALDKLNATSIATNFESRFLSNHAENKCFLWNCVFCADTDHLYCTLIDISASKETEANLNSLVAQNNQLFSPVDQQDYKVLFDINPMPMWAYDLETLKILMVNDAAVTLYGYSREEFLKLTLYELRPKTEHERLSNVLERKHLFTTYKESEEWVHMKKDGSLLFVEIASHQISLNKHPARLTVVHNITAHRKAQNKLMRQDITLREIAQLSSHDLRGPVASILGLVSLFDHENQDVQLNNLIIENLKESAKNLDKVIHAIVKKTHDDGG
jgi:PAS domain S-box-containing protein